MLESQPPVDRQASVVRRGEIYWADLEPTLGNEQAGNRPVLILSADIFNLRSKTVIAIPLTSQMPKVGYPLVHEIAAPGLPKRSWAKIGQIRTLSIARLRGKIASATADDLEAVRQGLNDILSDW